MIENIDEKIKNLDDSIREFEIKSASLKADIIKLNEEMRAKNPTLSRTIDEIENATKISELESIFNELGFSDSIESIKIEELEQERKKLDDIEKKMEIELATLDANLKESLKIMKKDYNIDSELENLYQQIVNGDGDIKHYSKVVDDKLIEIESKIDELMQDSLVQNIGK